MQQAVCGCFSWISEGGKKKAAISFVGNPVFSAAIGIHVHNCCPVEYDGVVLMTDMFNCVVYLILLLFDFDWFSARFVYLLFSCAYSVEL